MFNECQGDKDQFMQRIKQTVEHTNGLVEKRIGYEEKIMQIWRDNGSLEQERESWMQYIQFEIQENQLKRAKLLFERALISLESDKNFWISYIYFIEKQLKDPSLVRAKFE